MIDIDGLDGEAADPEGFRLQRIQRSIHPPHEFKRRYRAKFPSLYLFHMSKASMAMISVHETSDILRDSGLLIQSLYKG